MQQPSNGQAGPRVFKYEAVAQLGRVAPIWVAIQSFDCKAHFLLASALHTTAGSDAPSRVPAHTLQAGIALRGCKCWMHPGRGQGVPADRKSSHGVWPVASGEWVAQWGSVGTHWACTHAETTVCSRGQGGRLPIIAARAGHWLGLRPSCLLRAATVMQVPTVAMA